MKYIFVTGGVVSGLGKGICAASLGRLLKQCGLRVRNQKFDPYLNVDPGTMSPYQHGEVFVTDDGAETDLDLGHYERFVDEALTGDSSVSSGKIFWSVLNRERQGGYLGGTVQIIPHVTDEIKRRLYAMDDGQTDVVIAEIGGTVGDIESQPYLEAIRQVAAEQGRENVLYIHVPLVVSIPGSGELKSKPTQHSVKELLSVGIQPDILVCRTDSPLPEDMRKKIALFCNVSEDCVIPNLTASTLYEVPLLLEREGLCRVVCRKLGLGVGEPDMRHWQELVTQIHAAEQRHVTIALVGKYTELHDAYLSVAESLFHAGTACGAQVDIQWVDSQHLTAENLTETLCGCSGILVPGGFGDRWHPFRRYSSPRLAVLCPHTAAPAPWVCCSCGSRSNNKLRISCAPMSAPGRAPIRTHGGTFPCILVRYSPDVRPYRPAGTPVHSLEGFSGRTGNHTRELRPAQMRSAGRRCNRAWSSSHGSCGRWCDGRSQGGVCPPDARSPLSFCRCSTTRTEAASASESARWRE